MTAFHDLEIQSVGAPHSIHADRVVANMMRHLSLRHASLWELVDKITKGGFVRDGNPRAQGKLRDQIKAAGASFVRLTPGKRGKYKLLVSDLVGWDPATDRLIAVGEPVPEKPWLANMIHTIEGQGHGYVQYVSSISTYLTHHCLSRVTQHWAVRTIPELVKVAETVIHAVMEYDMKSDADWSRASSEGIKIPVSDVATAVLKRHEKYGAFVVVTLFGRNRSDQT
jgi:hypothetical protein